MKKPFLLVIILLVYTGVVFAQPATIVVTDTLRNSFGQPISGGTIHIALASDFMSADGFQIQAFPDLPVNISTLGLFTVNLVPTVGSNPTGIGYIVTYSYNSITEAWTIPASGPVGLNTVRTTPTPVPSASVALAAITSGGATANQVPIWNAVSNSWVPGNPASAAVSSVFGRTGNVVAVSGDYTAAQVTNAVSTLGTYASPSWLTQINWSIITGQPSLVNTFNSRSGTVTPATADYTAAMVTNAFDLTANNAWGAHYQDITDQSAPGSPSAGLTRIYTNSGKFCSKDSSGNINCTAGAATITSVFGRTGAVVAASADYTAAQVTNAVATNSANTYSGGGLQDFHAVTWEPPTTTVASLAHSATNQTWMVTDGSNAIDCTTGSGATRVWCVWNGASWQSMASAATAGVTSFITRTGAVVATPGDYNASQVTNAYDISTNNALGAHYATFTDISTPAAPSAGQTRYYSKGGKLCSEDPSSNESCGAVAPINTTFLSSNSSGQLVARTMTFVCTGTATSSTTIYFLVPSSTCTNTNGSAAVWQGIFGSVHTSTLSVVAGTGGINSSSGVVTVNVNGVGSTALTCTLGTGTSCTDNTHSYDSVGGTTGVQYAVQVTTQASETLSNLVVSFTY